VGARTRGTGVHVVYGLVGNKTHCKCCLVIRREGEQLRRYLHLGPAITIRDGAALYGHKSFDVSRESCRRSRAIVKYLTGLGRTPEFRHCWWRVNLQCAHSGLIAAETAHAATGRPARIIAKMNKLVDPVTIDGLYAASQPA